MRKAIQTSIFATVMLALAGCSDVAGTFDGVLAPYDSADEIDLDGDTDGVGYDSYDIYVETDYPDEWTPDWEWVEDGFWYTGDGWYYDEYYDEWWYYNEYTDEWCTYDETYDEWYCGY